MATGVCQCEAGFGGEDCSVNIDECAPKPCQNDATCEDLINNYKCHCNPGFEGTNCEINIDECATNPC